MSSLRDSLEESLLGIPSLDEQLNDIMRRVAVRLARARA